MLGQLAFGLWVAIVTLGGIYLGQNLTATSETHETAGAHGGSGANEFRTDLFAVPHVGDNGIAGYLTGRFTFRTDAAQAAALKIPLDTLIFDSLSRHFYAEAGAFSTSTGWERLRESLEDLRDLVNRTAGREVVTEVLVEQLDYFSKDDIRAGDEKSFGPAAGEE